jgi:alkylhydroperoxidase family enzyme
MKEKIAFWFLASMYLFVFAVGVLNLYRGFGNLSSIQSLGRGAASLREVQIELIVIDIVAMLVSGYCMIRLAREFRNPGGTSL